MTTAQQRIPRSALKERRQQVEERLAEFSGPRRLLREPYEGTRTRRLRLALESLGPVFASFGLYLSRRVDLLPERDCLELGAIGHLAQALPSSTVQYLIRRELGYTVQELFFTFEENPYELQPMSQSHRAQLVDGSEVVVRLMRPDVEDYLQRDMELLPLLRVGLANETISDAPFKSALEDFSQVVRQQVNCLEEAKAFEALSADAIEFGTLRSPVLYRSLCTSKVLTFERLIGRSLRDVLVSRGTRDQVGQPSGLRQERTTDTQLADRLFTVWLREALLGRCFPVEPAPANITILQNGQIAFTGGVFASLSPKSKANLFDYLVATATDDPDRACSRLFDELMKDEQSSEQTNFRRRFRQLVPLREGGWTSGGDGNSLAEYLFAHLRLAKESGYFSPAHLTSFSSGLFLVEKIARQLAPERDVLLDALQDVRLLAEVEKFRDLIDPHRFSEQLERYGPILIDLPQRLDAVLTLAAEGSARFKLPVPESVENRRRKNSSTVVIALLLLLAAFTFLSKRLALYGGWSDGFSVVVFIALGGLLLWAASRA